MDNYSLRKAAEMALDSLEWYVAEDDVVESMAGNEPWVEGKRKAEKSIQALRQALNVDAVNISQERVDETAKREQEPVAFVNGYFGGYLTITCFDSTLVLPDGLVLYTAPPKREWVELTDREITKIGNLDWDSAYVGIWYDFARAIEAKLKEKNCG